LARFFIGGLSVLPRVSGQPSSVVEVDAKTIASPDPDWPMNARAPAACASTNGRTGVTRAC